MFTGIIETMAKVVQKTDSGMVIARPLSFDDVKIGSSISVSGVCLSVVQLTESQMSFDVVPETWSRTKLGSVRQGDAVNLERSLKASDRFEGHIVQGHVEGTGSVTDIHSGEMKISLPMPLMKHVVEKGSIALDGVSLTVAKIDGDVVTVALIPHTLKVTTLGTLHTGDLVNIETDILGRYATL